MKLCLIKQSVECIFDIIYYAIKHLRMFFQLYILQFVIFLNNYHKAHNTHTQNNLYFKLISNIKNRNNYTLPTCSLSKI